MVRMFGKAIINFANFAVLAVVISLNASCTKKSESSILNIEMPNWNAVTASHSKTNNSSSKVGTLSGTKVTAVTRIMINVSGPGMTTAVRIWDSSDAPRAANSLAAPPAEFSFEVPRGSDRLFQALAILEEVDLSSGESSGPMTFLYGDLSKPVNQAVEAVPITLVNQAVATGTEGTLSGRYLASSGVGPTGKVNMFYAPVGGRPEMIVQTSTIFSGFLNLFVPPAGQFSYRLADSNVPLFEKITMNSFNSLLSTKLLRIEVPAAFRQSGGGPRDPTEARTRIVGFFGPGAQTQTICYNSLGTALNGLFTSADSANSTQVQWSAGSALATDARRIGGGLPYTGDMCPGGYGDFGVGHLFVATQALTGGDSPLGLNGPFQELSAGSNNFLTASFNGSQLSLYWKYLTPTIGDSVDGVGVFTKVFTTAEEANFRWHDSAPCSSLTSLGFTEVTRVAAGTQASPVQSYALTSINTAAYVSGRHVTALCPYSNAKGYYDFALTHSTGSDSPQNQATRLSVARIGEIATSSAGARTAIAGNSCTPMVVRTTDEYGNLVRKNSAPALINITHNGTGTTGISYDSNCLSATSSLSFYMPQDEYIFYLTIDAMDTAVDVYVDDSNSPILAGTIFYANRVTPSTPTLAIATPPSLIYQHQCFPFLTTKVSGVGFERIPEGNGGGQAISYATSLSQSGLSLFTDESCETAAGSLFFGGESLVASRKLYARYTGVLNSITFNPQVTGLTGESTTVFVVPPGPAVRAQLQLGSQVNPSTCVATKIMSQDIQGRSSPVSTTMTTTFSFSTAPAGTSGMFSDAGCTATISSASISSGQTASSTFYFRWETNETLTISSNGTSSLPLYPSMITVSP